jgi:hypothetical protein
LAWSAVGLGASPAEAAAAGMVKGSSGPLKATLTASTHTPKINQKVPITVTATIAGKAVRATSVYEFLLAGVQVAPTQYPYNNKHFSFTGHYNDNLVFPAAAVGQPLTLRVVVKASGHTVNLNWSITTQK